MSDQRTGTGPEPHSDAERSLFHARPRWQRVLFRWWRMNVTRHLPGTDRHGLPHKGYEFIVPPREWSQEDADWAIQRGQELAKEHGW